MKIQILKLIAGAQQAEGLTVIIDVFRAFSLECYLYGNGADKTIPIGDLDKAFALKREHPEYILIGERKGAIVPGCDYGNSPSAFSGIDLHGKTVIHTTSAGTQGIANAVHADEIITGALVNAKAIAAYIRQKNPAVVSLVPMGWEGRRDTEEDLLCADYLQSLLLDQPMPDIAAQALDQKNKEGKKFFDPAQQDRFPQADFWLCTKLNIFPFVLHVIRRGDWLQTEKLPVDVDSAA